MSVKFVSLFLRHVLAALLLMQPALYAYGEASSESQVKAAFLINFLKYVEWPENHVASTICLFGRDTLTPYLVAYEGRQVAGHELRIRHLTSPEQIGECQLLFIPDSEEARFGAVLRWAEHQQVLTVSDSDIFTRLGGAVALIRADGRLQFEINADALNRAGLKPSSQLMKLARSIKGAP